MSKKILVYGAGAIGSTFGGLLAKAGNSVAILGRPWHTNAIKANGLKITGIWGEHLIKNVDSYSDPHLLEKEHDSSFDLILLTVKAYDTVSASADLINFLGGHALVVSLQNGLGNIEALENNISKKQIIAGRLFLGAKITGPASVLITVSGEDTIIGKISNDLSDDKLQEVATMFSQAGIKCKTSKEIQTQIWSKVIFNCALTPLSAILNTSYGELLLSEHSKNIMKRIINEIYAVAAKKEIKLDPETPVHYTSLLFNKLIPSTAAYRSFMSQALEAGKKTEIDSLNGAIWKMGAEFGIPTPTNQILTEMIKSKEKI